MMNRRIAASGLALVTLLLLGGSNAAAAGAKIGGLKDGVISPSLGSDPVVRPLKLKGGGQIDLATFAFNFAGNATHLGLYSSTGTIDPSTFQISGTITAADGDTLSYVAGFQPGPLGEIEATFNITGGTGRFANASGSASGPVALDADFTFLLNLQGTIAF
jgi:hypothetical protein